MDKNRGLWRGKTTPKHNGEAFNEVWVKGNLIYSENRYYIHPVANVVKVQGELSKLLVMHEIDLSTLGECTGLRDKNGRLIFEGDIVNCKSISDNANMVVIFECGQFRMVCAEDYSSYQTDSGYYNINCFEKEIIGNIHDVD